MDFNTYQALAKTTAIYPESIKGLYPLMGLVGETGEVVEKIMDIVIVSIPKSEINSPAAQKVTRVLEILKTVQLLGTELETIKKDFRKNGIGNGISTMILSDFDKLNELKKEIGDQIWYQAATCSDFEFQMEDVAVTNYNKLKDRMERNVIHGSGDSR